MNKGNKKHMKRRIQICKYFFMINTAQNPCDQTKLKSINKKWTTYNIYFMSGRVRNFDEVFWIEDEGWLFNLEMGGGNCLHVVISESILEGESSILEPDLLRCRATDRIFAGDGLLGVNLSKVEFIRGCELELGF